MNTKLALPIILLVVFTFSNPALGQLTPSLIAYDSQGTAYTAPDNSTVFFITAGNDFSMEIKGAPLAPYGLFVSL